MSKLSALAALSIGTAMVSPAFGDRYIPVVSGGGPPRPKEPGTGECKCGRRISYWAGQCAACAGVTDSPTARRMARATARVEHRNKLHEAIRRIVAEDPSSVEKVIANLQVNTTGEGLALYMRNSKHLSRRWRKRIAEVERQCNALLGHMEKAQSMLCQDLSIEVMKEGE